MIDRRRILSAFGSVAAGAVLAVAVLTVTANTALAQDKYITVASTTSTENSGLFDVLLPEFTDKTGIEVRVVAVGTGQAIKLAQNGDADVLFVHHKPSERKFVAEGYGVERFDVMYNDFVIVGPKSDPAGIEGMTDAPAALARIAEAKAPFASRGDDSGTHKKELGLWSAADIDVQAASGTWYRETGSGMGPTLNTASGMNAYALTDRATWLNFANKGELAILVEGDERLFNQYGIILVNPEKYPHVKAELGQTFIDWVISPEGQKVIAEYKIKGEQAFFPNAKKMSM
ncbi:MAG TPA: substrate-binding domain-containing protein [Kiloniellales bacterium]|nr:substrate-binding domain-containing protein [Kiloniellales bacterium]